MARTWAITRRQTPWHRPESRPGKQTAPKRSIVFSRTTSVDSLATARTNQEAHAVKQLHCTSRLGFNFSYSALRQLGDIRCDPPPLIARDQCPLYPQKRTSELSRGMS